MACILNYASVLTVTANDRVIIQLAAMRRRHRKGCNVYKNVIIGLSRYCNYHVLSITAGFVSAYRYIATANLPIIAIFGEYLRQFLIDLHQIYRHSSVPKKHVSVHFSSFLAQAVSEHGAAASFFGHIVPVTVYRTPRLLHTSILWLN